MLKKGFLKPEISVSNLGKKKFRTGIAIDVGISFVLCYLFNYSREALRSVTFANPDPYILSDKEFRLYDLFRVVFATSLGSGFTIIYRMSGRNHYLKKKRLRYYVAANSWWITFIGLAVVTRYGTIFPFVV